MENTKNLIFKAAIFAVFALFLLSSASAYDFTVSVSADQISGCACNVADNTISIRNDGNAYAAFSISQDGDSAYYSVLGANIVMLVPGETANIKSKVRVPCSIKDPRTLITKISAMGDEKILAQSVAASDSSGCNDFSLDLNITKGPLCNGAGYWFYIKTQNNADVPYYVGFQVGQPKYAYMANQSVAVGAHSASFAFGRINVPADEFGQKKMIITGMPSNGGQSKQIEYQYDVAPCFYPGLRFESVNSWVCYEQQVSVNIDILNEGTKDDNYDMTLVSPDDAVLSSKSVSVAAGKKTQIKVQLSPENRDYQIPIKVKLQSQTNPNIKLEAQAKVNINSIATCKKPALDVKEIINENLTSKEYSMKLSNAGTAKADYIISSTGPDWVKMTPHFASLSPGESMDILFALDLNENVSSGKYIENITLAVKDSDQKFSYILPITLNKSQPLNLDMRIVWIVGAAIIVLALIIFLLIYLSRRPKGLSETEPELFAGSQRPMKNPTNFILLILVLLLAAALIATAFLNLRPAMLSKEHCDQLKNICAIEAENYSSDVITMPGPQPQESDGAASPPAPAPEVIEPEAVLKEDPFLYHKMTQNTRLEINLSSYIVDMDNSGLIFKAVPSEHIDVLVDRNIATIIPQGNWTGMENISFIVKNNKGFEKETPAIYIRVETPTRNWGATFQKVKKDLEANKIPLLVFLFIIVAIIIVFIILTRRIKKKIIVKTVKNKRKR